MHSLWLTGEVKDGLLLQRMLLKLTSKSSTYFFKGFSTLRSAIGSSCSKRTVQTVNSVLQQRYLHAAFGYDLAALRQAKWHQKSISICTACRT